MTQSQRKHWEKVAIPRIVERIKQAVLIADESFRLIQEEGQILEEEIRQRQADSMAEARQGRLF